MGGPAWRCRYLFIISTAYYWRATDTAIRRTCEATRNAKLEEWRTHPRERMRIVIPSGYVMPVKHYVRDPYMCKHDFDIQEIDTPYVREAILRHMGQLLRGFRYELHTHLKEAYCDKASQSRSRLTVMHYDGSKSFAQYQYELDRMMEIGS
ncbi:hypothetical protein COCNU_scaffold003580G000010 [Cocos nucifera]|nr:hypothetical protein [Cocos nucifera]